MLRICLLLSSISYLFLAHHSHTSLHTRINFHTNSSHRTHRHVELTPTLLRYFDGPANKGSVLLLDACLVDLSDGQGKDGEFCLTSRAGYRLKMRASSKADKQRWCVLCCVHAWMHY